MDDTSEQLEQAGSDFVTSMRLGKGFNEEKLNALKNALRSLNSKWASSDVLPKSCVVTLIDLSRMIESCASHYSGEEQQKIIDASHEITDVILEAF